MGIGAVIGKYGFTIFLVFPVLILLMPIQDVSAGLIGPTISWSSPTYTLNDGGPLGPPVKVTVTDETKTGENTIEITITSKDNSGTIIDVITLQLNELGNSGTFVNDNLIFTNGEDLITVDDTVTISIQRDCVPEKIIVPGFPPFPPLIQPEYGNCKTDEIETLGNLPAPSLPTGLVVLSSSQPFTPLVPTLTETGPDTGLFMATIEFSIGASDPSTNTLGVQEGDIVSVIDFANPSGFPQVSNGLIIPNSNPSIGAIEAVVGGTVTAEYNPSATADIIPGGGPGTGGGGALRPGLVVDKDPDTTGGTGHEPPTIGRNLDGTIQHVGNGGIAIDGNQFLVTKQFHQEFKLYEMLTGEHTISNIVYCPRGVDTCNYLAIGVTPYDGNVDDAIWWIELRKNLLGKWDVKVFDETGKIGDPVTFTTQKIDKYRLGTSLTVPFNNIETPPLKLWVQVRDNQFGVRNFYFNEGVQFKDADAYPFVEPSFEPPIKIEQLCLNENPNQRNSCAFEKVKKWTTNKAEQLMQKIMNENR